MRPNYQWHKKQQIVSSSAPTATTEYGTVQASATAVVTVTPQPANPAAVTASASQLPPSMQAVGGKLTLPVSAQGATSNIGQDKEPSTLTNLVAVVSRPPDDLNYYGTYNEDLDYPYISIHYDFNRAYYHNHDYTYLNSSVTRSSCISHDSPGEDGMPK
jgi:hypothetical protein